MTSIKAPTSEDLVSYVENGEFVGGSVFYCVITGKDPHSTMYKNFYSVAPAMMNPENIWELIPNMDEAVSFVGIDEIGTIRPTGNTHASMLSKVTCIDQDEDILFEGMEENARLGPKRLHIMQIITEIMLYNMKVGRRDKRVLNLIGSHITHCCEKHGCKYGDKECVVYTKLMGQEYSCEQCYDEKYTPIFRQF